ncbi:hypothetical protein HK102_003797 [Quaeritorhiza haematococci]|nr:hypothetical protein HK102_003797 [Quaeritorhiza haematococci]
MSGKTTSALHSIFAWCIILLSVMSHSSCTPIPRQSDFQNAHSTPDSTLHSAAPSAKPDFITVLHHTTNHIIKPAFTLISKAIDDTLKSHAQEFLAVVITKEAPSTRIAVKQMADKLRSDVLNGFSVEFMNELAAKYQSVVLQYQVVVPSADGNENEGEQRQERFADVVSRRYKTIVDHEVQEWLGKTLPTRLVEEIQSLIGHGSEAGRMEVTAAYFPVEMWRPVERQIREMLAGDGLKPFMDGVSEVLVWLA